MINFIKKIYTQVIKTFATFQRFHFVSYFIAFGLGEFFSTSFAPMGWFFAPFISLSWLLSRQFHANLPTKKLFLEGWLFGIGILMYGTDFLEYTFYTFTSLPEYFKYMIILGHHTIFAFSWGILTLGTRVLHKKFKLPIIFGFISLQFLLESFFPQVLPYYIGTTQVENNSLIHIADTVGSKGLSIFMLLIIYFFVRFIHFKKMIYFFSGISILSFISLYSGVRYVYWKGLQAHSTEKKIIPVSLVQPNFLLTEAPELQSMIYNTLIDYTELFLRMPDASKRILVLPESAFPFRIDSLYAKNLLEIWGKNQVHVFFNHLSRRDGKAYSSISFFSPNIEGEEAPTVPSYDETHLQSYDKTKLMPFGEYLPLREYLPQSFIDGIPLASDLTPGENINHIRLPEQFGSYTVAPFICYEILYADIVSNSIRHQHADFLMNLTNDRWFGPTKASFLHLSLAKARSIENRLPMVYVTNNGPSTVINSMGEETSPSSLFWRRAFIHTYIPLEEGISSIYLLIGDFFCWLFLSIYALAILIHKKYKPLPSCLGLIHESE